RVVIQLLPRSQSPIPNPQSRRAGGVSPLILIRASVESGGLRPPLAKPPSSTGQPRPVEQPHEYPSAEERPGHRPVAKSGSRRRPVAGRRQSRRSRAAEPHA